jgi:hypothetical protein
MDENNKDGNVDNDEMVEGATFEKPIDESELNKKENNTEKEEKKEEKYDIKQNIGEMFESMGKIMTSIGKSIKNNNMDINSALDQVRSFTSMEPSKLQDPTEIAKMVNNQNTDNQGNKGNKGESKKGTETKSRPKGRPKGRQTNRKKRGGSDVNEVFAEFKRWTEPLINLYGTRGFSQIDVTRKMLDEVQSTKSFKKGGSKRKTRKKRSYN